MNDKWEPAPFHDYNSFIKWAQEQRETNNDLIMLFTGREGRGKSTLAGTVLKDLEPSFDLLDAVFDFEDLLPLFEDLQRGQVSLIDEGGNLMFSRDAMTKESKYLVRFLQMARILNTVVALCVPKLAWVDVYVREHRALVRFHVIRRGYAVCQYRSENWRYDESRWVDVFTLSFEKWLDTPVVKAYEEIKIAKTMAVLHDAAKLKR